MWLVVVTAPHTKQKSLNFSFFESIKRKQKKTNKFLINRVYKSETEYRISKKEKAITQSRLPSSLPLSISPLSLSSSSSKLN